MSKLRRRVAQMKGPEAMPCEMGKGTKKEVGHLEKEDGTHDHGCRGSWGPRMVLSTEAFRPDTTAPRNPINYPEQRNKMKQGLSEELIAFHLHCSDRSRMNPGRWPPWQAQ